MKPIDNFKPHVTYDFGGKLPAGNYVCMVKSVKVEDGGQFNDKLALAVDIYEGEYTGYFQRKFDNSQYDDKKWGGVCRLPIPDKNKSRYFDSDLRRFETAIASFEESNTGFHWDWDEKKLNGKIAGFRFRDEQFENQLGNVVDFVKCFDVVPADDVRSGKAKTLKAKPLKDNAPAPAAFSTAAPNDFEIINTDDDLPF